MNTLSQPNQTLPAFTLGRLSKSKDIVDLVPNTLREYHAQGLPFYRMGKAVFFSIPELEMFIRLGPEKFKAAIAARQ